MSSLLPNNATPQEVAIEQATARIGNVDVPIRTLWDPENCPADILPWLAWAFSVDKWDATWTEAQKRAIVAGAIFVHQRKGTPAAVKEVVNAIFGGGDIVEAWQDVDLSAHEFKIVTTGTFTADAQFAELIDLVDGAKPVRSHLVAVQILRASTRRLYFGTATRSGGKTTLRGRLAIDPDALDLFYGVATRYATRTTIDAQDPSFAVNGFEPEFVASFDKSSPDVKRWNYYRANGVEVDFSKAFDFARAGGATYVDATGTIQTAAANVPRVGHHVWDGSAWVNEGLLYESEARTNVFSYNKFDDAALQSTSQTLGASVQIGGSGSGVTTEVVAVGLEGGIPYFDWDVSGTNTGGSTLFIVIRDTASIAAVDGDTYTVSANLKLVSGSVTESNNLQFYCHFRDAGDALISAPAFVLGASLTSQWQRFHASFTGTGASISKIVDKGIFLRVSAGGSVNFRVRIGGMQVEKAPTPSSYIPTAGSTVTRAAETNSTDNATYDASAMWGVMKGTETYADLGTAGQVELLDWRDDVDNRITITLDTDGAETGEITLTMVNGGASASVAVDAMTPGINQALSLAWRVTGSEIAISCNGGAAVSAATAIGIPDLSAASIVLEGMGARALITQGTGDIGDTGIEEASA